MERYVKFLDQKNQYCENDQAIYRFSAIPIKLLVAFFIELELKKFTICMEMQKTPNSHSSLEKEERSWRDQPS